MKHKISRRFAVLLCLVVVLWVVVISAASDTAAAAADDPESPDVTETTEPTDTPTTEPTDTPEPVEPVVSVNIAETDLTLKTGDKYALKTTVNPANTVVQWSTSNSKVAIVDKGTITATGKGEAVITASSGNASDSCTVTVWTPVASMNFPRDEIVLKDHKIALNREYSFALGLYPEDADYEAIVFESKNESVATIEKVKSSAVSDKMNPLGKITGVYPGETDITAELEGLDGQPAINQRVCHVIVSGIVLSTRTEDGNIVLDEDLDPDPLALTIGSNVNVSVETYGEAKNTSKVDWYSSDNTVVAVSSGRLTPRTEGNAKITAIRGAYSVSFNVTVGQDMSRVVGISDSVRAGEPYSFSSLGSEINKKWEGHTLSYITSLSVSPVQGTLYHGYISEADTGAGVSMTQRFYYNSSNSDDYRISDLTFVPRASFSGNAEITFTAMSTDNSSFSGVIRIPVDAMEDVSYTTGAGQNVFFLGSDFNTICRARTGRELASVTFTLPESSRGTMYYAYTTDGQYSEKVEAGRSYRRIGNPNLDGVSFMPADGFSGSVRISYHGLDTAGASFTGFVTVTVTDRSSATDADVVFTGRVGKEISFTVSQFNSACRTATGENLSYVEFKLPLSNEGTLYYNRSSSSRTAASANTPYYRSSSPAIGDISFVPASSAPKQVRIGFTGFSVGGSTFSGTVLLDYSETTGSQQTVRYSVYSGRAVQFDAADFNNACVNATGGTLDYVQFELPTAAQGVLCYDYSDGSTLNRVSASTRYYRAGSGTSGRLDRVWFLADSGYTGTVNISYTGYSTASESFKGTVTIQVNTLAPPEVIFSGSGSQAIRLSASQIRSACRAVMDNDLSYIQFTSLPSSSSGRLYRDYTGFDTGSQVIAGTQYYVSGSPAIDQLSFVPRGSFSGTATATYTGVSTSGERVSGRINFIVSSQGSSGYFNDMASYSWAVPSADYLYQNGVISGIGNGQYGPGLNIRRADFVMMLCSAYGFNDGGNTYSFADVPTDSYYAAAVSAAAQRGIVSGDGTNFFPDNQLTRQDAMVIIKNSLENAGWSLGGGSTDEISYFGDGGSVAPYAQEAVATLVRLGVVRGDTNGNLRPWDPVNRAEAAVMLHFVMTM